MERKHPVLRSALAKMYRKGRATVPATQPHRNAIIKQGVQNMMLASVLHNAGVRANDIGTFTPARKYPDDVASLALVLSVLGVNRPQGGE